MQHWVSLCLYSSHQLSRRYCYFYFYVFIPGLQMSSWVKVEIGFEPVSVELQSSCAQPLGLQRLIDWLTDWFLIPHWRIYVLILERKEGKEGEEEEEEGEKKRETSVGCLPHTPSRRIKPAALVCALDYGDPTHNLLVQGRCSNQPGHLAKARGFLKKCLFLLPEWNVYFPRIYNLRKTA